jgi:DNA-binding NtrC family response regulator
VLQPAAMAALVLAPWPGNVRELANLLERVAILAEGRSVGVNELGLEATACREAWADEGARHLAARLAGAETEELAAFLGAPVG